MVLPDLTYEDGINDNDSAPAVTFMPVKNGTEYDEKILSFCYFKAHRVSEIAEYLGVSDSSYLRKKCWEIWKKWVFNKGQSIASYIL